MREHLASDHRVTTLKHPGHIMSTSPMIEHLASDHRVTTQKRHCHIMSTCYMRDYLAVITLNTLVTP